MINWINVKEFSPPVNMEVLFLISTGYLQDFICQGYFEGGYWVIRTPCEFKYKVLDDYTKIRYWSPLPVGEIKENRNINL